LAANTTYQVKVAAMQGKFTQSAFGPYASSTTVSPSISFSLSPNTLTMTSLLPGNVIASPVVTATFATNASLGGGIYVLDTNAGLKSTFGNHTIAAVSNNLTSLGEGYGLQATGATQGSGGPLAAVSPFSGSGNTVGILATTFQPLFSTSTAVTAGSTTSVLRAKSSTSDPAASDYQDVLTFAAAANF